MLAFVTESNHKALAEVNNFTKLADIAIEVLTRMKAEGHEIVQICGPYTTGGLGSPELNGKRFDEVRETLVTRGFTVFDQMPFEGAIKRIKDSYNLPAGEYCEDILEVFYRLVFQSGHISKFLFIPGWESSKGSRWEREVADKFGILCEDIPPEWFVSSV
jgi:Domain of unknown function (DUF4406)